MTIKSVSTKFQILPDLKQKHNNIETMKGGEYLYLHANERSTIIDWYNFTIPHG